MQLTPSLAAPRPVGQLVRWTASATDTVAGTLDYRFSIRPPGGVFRIVRDYGASKVLDWTPSTNEGIYEIQVTARNKTTEGTAVRTQMYTVSSRVTGGSPVVSSTAHPLVALYSAPPCPSGSRMRVRFQRAGDPYGQRTPLKACTPGFSMNFYIAGMLANTQYSIRHDLFTGPTVTTGPTLSFTTGSLPPDFPAATVRNPPDPPSSLEQPVVLNSFFRTPGTVYPTATDLEGRVIWYYPEKGPGVRRPVPGGTVLLHKEDLTLIEVDLVGNIVRETNVDRVSEQLVAMGKRPITSFHHETFRMPNGNTVILCNNEQIMNNVQGPGASRHSWRRYRCSRSESASSVVLGCVRSS